MKLNNKPHRVQRKRMRGWTMPKNTVYVGRPSKWGNPFVTGKHGTSAECVSKFHACLLAVQNNSFSQIYDGELKRQLQDNKKQTSYFYRMAYELKELRGKNLACWCALDQPCHADILLELANR